MINHIHLIWQVQNGFKRDDVQRDFLKYVSQTIIKDLKINHPNILEEYYVGAKDRKYQIWQRNPLSIDLITKDIFIQKFDYVHYNAVAAGLCALPEDYKYSSAKYYETGWDEFGFLTHWLD
jgi:REP element-mobilizing transposase RayT